MPSAERTALHAHGLWWAFPTSNVATAIIAAIGFGRGDWKKGRLVARDAKEAEEQEVAKQVVL